jgi:hypothetical protein
MLLTYIDIAQNKTVIFTRTLTLWACHGPKSYDWRIKNGKEAHNLLGICAPKDGLKSFPFDKIQP